MTNHEWTTAPLPQITIAEMAAMTPIGTIAMTETAGAPIVMMTAVEEVMAPGMMIAVEGMVLGGMTAEDTSTGIMTVTALVTSATTMMMIVMKAAGTGLLNIATEGTWIIGTGIGMKGHGVLLVRQKDGANMEGIKRIAA